MGQRPPLYTANCVTVAKKNGLNWPNTNRALFKQHETLKFMQILKRKYKSSDPFLIEETTELITIFKAIEIGQKTHTYDELRPCTTSGVDPHYCRAPTTTTKITAAAAIQWARTLGFFFLFGWSKTDCRHCICSNCGISIGLQQFVVKCSTYITYWWLNSE